MIQNSGSNGKGKPLFSTKDEKDLPKDVKINKQKTTESDEKQVAI